jgi:hypothetical protein
MNPLSVTASIIEILQLSAKVLECISDVRDAPKERSLCEAEISNLCALLRALRDHLQAGEPSQPCYNAVADLVAPRGPFDRFKEALEALQSKIADGGRLEEVGQAHVDKLNDKDIAGILQPIGLLKTLVGIALQIDHAYVLKGN